MRRINHHVINDSVGLFSSLASSSSGISLTFLASLLNLRNSVSKLTSFRVLESVFVFCSSINLSIGLSSHTNLLDFSAFLEG